jgi:hypothetical protein
MLVVVTSYTIILNIWVFSGRTFLIGHTQLYWCSNWHGKSVLKSFFFHYFLFISSKWKFLSLTWRENTIFHWVWPTLMDTLDTLSHTPLDQSWKLNKPYGDIQGRSQKITGVTVVTGPWGPWGGSRRVLRGPQEGSHKGSGPEKGCESKGRCNLFLRKRNKIRKKNQSEGVLRVVGGPWST